MNSYTHVENYQIAVTRDTETHQFEVREYRTTMTDVVNTVYFRMAFI
ncbi:hypothetical protein NAF17_12540 [Mucilaginibacter sp. RB4R14]|nr:hypothetical protein [Mucilaginibacter aurantiaciroseus]MCO5936369.1 hypothetical protein [Mucilaginibacter aurantiaciroseus]